MTQLLNTTTNSDTNAKSQENFAAHLTNEEATGDSTSNSPTTSLHLSSIHSADPFGHSVLCRNIQKARDKGKHYRDLRDELADLSIAEDARTEFIDSLNIVNNSKLSAQGTEVCSGCCASGRYSQSTWDSGKVNEWYQNKVETDNWELMAEAAELGVTLDS